MMKRFVYLLICMLCPLLSWAQRSYLPFVEEGKKWEIEMHRGTPDDTVIYVLRGDTLIGDIPAKKLYEKSTRGLYAFKSFAYSCALFEQDGDVMCIPSGSLTPTLLYRFAEPGSDLGQHPLLWKGEIVWSPYTAGRPLYVRQTSLEWNYIENSGIRRLVQKTKLFEAEGETEDTVDIIEGVGTEFGPVTLHTNWYVTGWSYYRILSVTVGDRVDYSVTGVSPLLAAPSGAEMLHGLDGRRLNAPPQHGVYLRNGKKVAK